MENQRRTQEQRSAATRAALVDAARRLWAERGYAEVGTPEIAGSAGVTRGAMYHQFADKAALFHAVIEAVQGDMVSRLAEAVKATEPPSPAAALRAAVDAWLTIAGGAEIRQLVLLDAPQVLGWEGFRDVTQRYSLGMTEALLTAAIEAGQLPAQPVRPLAHILLGALDEAAMVVAADPNPDEARAQVRDVLHRLVGGMLTDV